MRIIQTVGSIEAEASGPSYSVPSLCRSLANLGHTVELLSLGAVGTVGITIRDGYRDIRFARNWTGAGPLRKLGTSFDMRRALFVSNADIIHTHGLWMMPNVYAADAARRLARPLVLTPRGMLGADALKFSSGRKRAFWALYQGHATRRVSCFHATAESEYDDIRAFGLKQPVAVIPNGIDLPASSRSRASLVGPFVLSLGRIHPKKGLDRLLRAWALIEAGFPAWGLRIVGPSEGGHANELEQQVRELGLSSISISGPVFGEAKLELLANAQLFTLSTLHENFAMTVAESLACETPVISTKGAPWQGLVDNKCGWWIEHGPEAMAAALREAMSLSPEERRAMGARGRAWMERDFGWQGIATQMAEVYRWLVAGGEPPACVRMG